MGTFTGGRHLTHGPCLHTVNVYVPHTSHEVLINRILLVDRHSDVRCDLSYPISNCTWAMQIGKIQAIHLHKNGLRASQTHYIPKVICLPSLAHLYSCTKSNWEENSCFLGHCSQKNKYVVKKMITKQHFLTLPAISICYSQEVWKFSKTVFSVFHKKPFFSWSFSSPVLDSRPLWNCWPTPMTAEGPILRLYNPEPRLLSPEAAGQEPGMSLSVRD